jgi:hypothetical protein
VKSLDYLGGVVRASGLEFVGNTGKSLLFCGVRRMLDSHLPCYLIDDFAGCGSRIFVAAQLH